MTVNDEPTGRPDTARSVTRRGGAVVMRFRTNGEITVTAPTDPWLSGPEAAELAGMTSGSWRSLVRRGYAPPADDPGDQTAHPSRRNPRWRQSTVVKYRVRARYRGKAKNEGDA